MCECIYDEKVNKVLELLGQGQSKEDIANYFGHGWTGVGMYLRRKGFCWNDTTFIEKEEDPKAIHDAQFQNNKAGYISTPIELPKCKYRSNCTQKRIHISTRTR